VSISKDRAEEEKTAASRTHAHELKRADELLRERQAELDRLRAEVAQLQERDESRKKMSLLEEEVRTRSSRGARLPSPSLRPPSPPPTPTTNPSFNPLAHPTHPQSQPQPQP